MLRVVYGFINLCHSCDWGDLVCLYTTMRDGWVKGQEVNCWVYWSSASWSCPSALSWWSNYKQLSRGSKRRLGQAIDHGMELLVSHLFCILICPLLYICSACLHYHFSLIRGREGISLSISIIRAYQRTILQVCHLAHFDAQRRFFKANYGARVDTC